MCWCRCRCIGRGSGSGGSINRPGSRTPYPNFPACRPPIICSRARATPPQFGLARKERARNVQGAFEVPKASRIEVKGKKLVLVDDILTTGATADACAKALSRAGAARVDVLVLARVVDQA